VTPRATAHIFGLLDGSLEAVIALANLPYNPHPASIPVVSFRPVDEAMKSLSSQVIDSLLAQAGG